MTARQSKADAAKERDAYWLDVLKHRMPLRDEVSRLVTILYGMRAQSSHPDQDILDFWGDTRPYGNKDIPASIAFTLGWDYRRRLCTEGMPEFIADEAFRLHDAVRWYLITGEYPTAPAIHLHISG